MWLMVAGIGMLPFRLKINSDRSFYFAKNRRNVFLVEAGNVELQSLFFPCRRLFIFPEQPLACFKFRGMH
jgi:hypothetical protein